MVTSTLAIQGKLFLSSSYQIRLKLLFCSFGDYIWPALVLWAFDRVLRLVRLVWNNRLRFSKTHEHSIATVDLLSEDTVRLTLRRHMSWKAGQHAYVILPTISEIPTEAHPFTIASIPQSLDGTNGAEEKEVSFLIRGRSGFTGRLREAATSKGNHTVPAFIDGPYGCPPDLTVYSTCVLIAGEISLAHCSTVMLTSKYRRIRRVLHASPSTESSPVSHLLSSYLPKLSDIWHFTVMRVPIAQV